MDEYIRLDTTIIGIDNLIAKASTAEEANALFKAKDVIYSQQRCSTDVQPVKHGRWKYYKNNGIINTYICTNCHGKVEMAIDVEPSKFKYCPNCGARMGGDSDD